MFCFRSSLVLAVAAVGLVAASAGTASAQYPNPVVAQSDHHQRDVQPLDRPLVHRHDPQQRPLQLLRPVPRLRRSGFGAVGEPLRAGRSRRRGAGARHHLDQRRRAARQPQPHRLPLRSRRRLAGDGANQLRPLTGGSPKAIQAGPKGPRGSGRAAGTFFLSGKAWASAGAARARPHQGNSPAKPLPADGRIGRGVCATQNAACNGCFTVSLPDFFKRAHVLQQKIFH